MNIEEKHHKMLYPCVRVRTDKAGGSGTVIYSKPRNQGKGYETYILTNHHVIADNIKVGKKWSTLLQREVQTDILSECSVEFFDFEYTSWEGGHQAQRASICCYDKDIDLGLLQLKSEKEIEHVATLFPKDQHKERLRIFQGVYAVGCGLGHPPLATTGQLNGFSDIIDNYPYILSSAATIFGNSGGSLYLDTGEFIGVPARIAVTGGLFGGTDAITHLSFAIPVWTIYDFLDAQVYDFIYDPTKTSEDCTKIRKGKRERDEERMAIEISRKGGDVK